MRRSFLRLITFFRSRRAESELSREIAAHLQLLEDQFVAKGMSVAEARFAARRAFGGGVEQVKERQRDARTYRVLDHWWLDIKLGVRMLARNPGLTLVAVLGMAVAIAISVGAFSIIGGMLNPVIPLPDGERLVSVQNWDAATNSADRRALHDFPTWHAEVTAIEELSLVRQVSRTLMIPGAAAEVVRVAEMSASGFRVTRVAPQLGRYLLEEDETRAAAPVVVIGHDVWRARFNSDPAILGRVIQLGASAHAIVGVMPERFAFPVNHQYWIPLVSNAEYERRDGPEVWAFGRLAPGESLTSAQTQLTTIGRRFAAAFPSTHEHLRPQVVPYTYPFTDTDDPENAMALRVMRFLVALLLAVVCGNVAILVYARTVTRQAEVAVRTALGAGRRRIVVQLFIEALALALLAAVAGVVIVSVALRAVDAAISQIAGQLPFWMTFELTAGGVLYALILAVCAAAIVGIIPALKATGRDVQQGLKRVSAGGNAGIRLGKTWTALVVVQVGLAVSLLPTTVYHAWNATRHGVSEAGFPADEFLSAQLVLERTQHAANAADAETAFRSRYSERHAELMRQLSTTADIAGATFALQHPGFEPSAWIEVDGITQPTEKDDRRVSAGTTQGHAVRFNRIDVEWFSVFRVQLLTGRAFRPADASAPDHVVIVNRAFVDRILRGSNPLGRSLRYVGISGDAEPDVVSLERQYEIVGIVEDFPATGVGASAAESKVYHPTTVGGIYPARLAVRVRGGDALTFASDLLNLTAAIDPMLQAQGIRRLDQLLQQEQSIFRVIAGVLLILMSSVVVLSAAGIYALTSCTVEQRRKEIGIRAALGANPRRLLAAVFARAFAQLAGGAIAGLVIAAILEFGSGGEMLENNAGFILPAVAAFMTLVGLAAAWGPARHGLRVELTETLRAD